MKRSMTILIALVLVSSAGSASAEIYGWSISISSTTCAFNTGEFVSGLQNLYLWHNYTTSSANIASADMLLTADNAANVFLAFTPANGFLNAGGPRPCCSPWVAARIRRSWPVPSSC